MILQQCAVIAGVANQYGPQKAVTCGIQYQLFICASDAIVDLTDTRTDGACLRIANRANFNAKQFKLGAHVCTLKLGLLILGQMRCELTRHVIARSN